MKENEILKNVIIFDGEKEYSVKDVLSNVKMLKFFNTYYVLYFPKFIQEEVIKENGIFYITTNKEFEKASIELKNVSKELNDQFLSK
jgi:hypothetical protein|tara:strand:+ start:55 stop:315 length:261 start_codon:yes stop_codon:yes gene_type:complete